MSEAEDLLTIVVSGAQLSLLKKLDFPCSQDVLASAARIEEGIELTGSWSDFDSLAGWVAGEANDSSRRRPGGRRTELLHDLADEIEHALSCHGRGRPG